MAGFIDARTLPEGSEIHSDLCIVGAGAAGITLALRLRNSGLNVCLIESGGLEFEAETQNLYEGEMKGFDAYATNSNRLRYFGGTTNHWNGNIWPLFDDDFKKRDWIPESGWPLTRTDLEPYYVTAAEICEMMGPYNWDPNGLKDHLYPVFFDSRVTESQSLEPAVLQHSPPTRFGSRYQADLQSAENIKVYLYANVCTLDGKVPGKLEWLGVKTLNGLELRFHARQFVLCTGGLENARLLLNSQPWNAKALGNEYDLVGRYFMDHPLARLGRVEFFDLKDAALKVPPQSPNQGVKGALTLTGASMEKLGVARVVALLSSVSKMDTRKAVKNFTEQSQLAWESGDGWIDSYLKWNDSAETLGKDLAKIYGLRDSVEAYADFVIEQLPYRESRVGVSNRNDRFGQPQISLDWRFSPEQARHTQEALKLMASAIGASGLGRMQVDTDLDFTDPGRFKFSSSFHHMGTTRMSDKPAEGVVDRSLRVHSVENLYVCGSSVFTTGGVSNPTLTICALATRLADHLQGLA